MALAVIVANEHRAGFEPAAGRAGAARQTLQQAQAFTIKAANGLFLQAPGQHSPQEVLAQTGRRRSPEDRPPTPPKRIKRKRAQVSDFGLDRGRICPLLPHGYGRGAPALSLPT
jgi:hypothetical protein